jgi:hypothetical protein
MCICNWASGISDENTRMYAFHACLPCIYLKTNKSCTGFKEFVEYGEIQMPCSGYSVQWISVIQTTSVLPGTRVFGSREIYLLMTEKTRLQLLWLLIIQESCRKASRTYAGGIHWPYLIKWLDPNPMLRAVPKANSCNLWIVRSSHKISSELKHVQPRQRSRYSDWLRARPPRVRSSSPGKGKIFLLSTLQTSFWAYPVSYTAGTEVKATGEWKRPLTSN